MSMTSESSTDSIVNLGSCTRPARQNSNEPHQKVQGNDQPFEALNDVENFHPVRLRGSRLSFLPTRRYSSTLSRWRRKGTSTTIDIEMNKLSASEDLKDQRRNLLQTLFGIDDKTRSDWPGTELYLVYLEAQFKLVGNARFEEIWPLLGFQLPPTISDGLRFISMVAASCKSTRKEGLSIDELLQSVLASTEISREDISNQLTISNRQAIFTVVSWLTMLVQPSSNVFGGRLHIIVDKKLEALQESQSQDRSPTPIFSLFRGFGCLVPSEARESNRHREAPSNVLDVSSLNYFCLKTIGKVNIKWTHTLDSHLMFHQRTRTLSLFGFPTFCALNIIAESNGGSFFDRILCDSINIEAKNQSHISVYKREVLLSYRVLFGQSEKARRLFRKSEIHKIPKFNGVYDPLLTTLCGKPSSRAMKSLPSELWIETWRDFAGHLLEQEIYSADTDFPVLGARLLELQAFNSSQKANRIWDIWRDRRNPLQWYTFWAVIIIGGLTLIISVVQTTLSGAQLAASRPLPNSK